MESQNFTKGNKDFDKVAILILAHKNINQLCRLVNALKHPRVDVFIHMDKKWNISDSEINKVKSIHEGNVFVSKHRVSASLDTWSLVEATMELLKDTKEIEREKKVKYSYTALLSAQDYPIKNMDYIVNELIEVYPKPIIDCTPYHQENWLYHKFNKLPAEIKINSYINSHFNNGALRKVVKVPFFAYFKVAKKFKTIYSTLKEHNCELYGGSAWWILPDMVIEEMLKECNTNSELFSELKKVHTPEENFFQIMTMRSSVASLVTLNPYDMVEQNCMTYAYFSDEGKPFTGHPYIFTAKEFDKISKLSHFFARKFDEVYDSEILDMIDNNILKEK